MGDYISILDYFTPKQIDAALDEWSRRIGTDLNESIDNDPDPYCRFCGESIFDCVCTCHCELMDDGLDCNYCHNRRLDK